MRAMARGIGGALAMAAVCCAMSSAQASAADFELQAKLPSSDGTAIRLNVERGLAFVTVIDRTHRGGRVATLIRIMRGGLSADGQRVDADLGKYGAIHARFIATGEDDPRVTCLVPGKRLKGHLVGRISFAGLTGVKGARAHRVDAVLQRYRRAQCDRPEPSKRPVSFDYLSTCSERGNLQYSATSVPDEFTLHDVGLSKLLTKRIVLFTQASRSDDSTTFQVEPDLGTARVSPGYPFDGVGLFDERRLTGDLSVDLIGVRKPVPLVPARASLKRVDDGSVSSSCGNSGSGVQIVERLGGRADPRAIARLLRKAGPSAFGG